MIIIGEKHLVAFEIGNYVGQSLAHQHVDLWIGNKRVTQPDNAVYLPSFYTKLKAEIERLKTTDEPVFDPADPEVKIFEILDSSNNSTYRVFHYDISVNTAKCFLYRCGSNHKITCLIVDPRYRPQNDLGKLFTVTIDKGKLVELLTITLSKIPNTWV